MSYNTELYSVEKGTINGDDYLFVLYNGNAASRRISPTARLHWRTISRVKTFTQANDTMEAHANGKPLPIFDGKREVIDDETHARAHHNASGDQQLIAENKAFQYDLAEENAELRKKLTEEHNNMVLISNELVDALEVKEDLEQSTLSAQVRNSNAEVEVDDLTEENAMLQGRVVSLVYRMDSLEEQLEEFIGKGDEMVDNKPKNPRNFRDPLDSIDHCAQDYFLKRIDDGGGTGLVYKMETDQDVVRFTASNDYYNQEIELPIGITLTLMHELHNNLQTAFSRNININSKEN